jgi:hypothetical protein
MKNEFMHAAWEARYQLLVKQRAHTRMKGRADMRLQRAQQRHAAEVAQAEMAEANAWMELMGIPGVTIPTAAALMEVSESTVSRWVARYNRGLEEERTMGSGGAP